MQDSNGHNRFTKKGETIMVKTVTLEENEMLHLAQFFFEVEQELGIVPWDFKSTRDFTEAAIRLENSNTLREFAEFTELPRFQEIIKDELKKRGELS